MGELERAFGLRLKQLRQEAGLTQEDLADRAKLDYKALGAIEHGRNVTLRTVERLATALGIAPREFFADAPRPQLSGHQYRISVLSTLIAQLDPASRTQVIRLVRHLQRLKGKPSK